MKRVLLTGATGLIGRWTIRPLLDGGYEVHVLENPHGSAGAADVPDIAGTSRHAADLLSRRTVSKLVADIEPTHLLHLAWNVEHDKYRASLENLKWLDATVDLFERFSATSGRRAVLVGSCAEYDWSRPVLSEHTTPIKPTTLYGACKHAAHVVCSALAAQRQVELAWGRVFFPYGGGESRRRLVPSMIDSLLAGEMPICRNPSARRDFIYSEDAGSAIVALLDSNVCGPVNIASGRAIAIKDVLATIGRQLGEPDIAAPDAPPLPDEPETIVADVGRLRDEVGFEPRFNLEQGIVRTIDSRRHASR